MELFCHSPIAQEKSRDLPRMGCLFSKHFPCYSAAVSSKRSPVLWAALCCPLADRELGRFVCLNLFRPRYFKFTPGCAGGQRVELSSPAPFPGLPVPFQPAPVRMALDGSASQLDPEMFDIFISGSKQQLPFSPGNPLAPNSSWS